MDTQRDLRITLAITGATGAGFGAAVARRLATSPQVGQVTLLRLPHRAALPAGRVRAAPGGPAGPGPQGPAPGRAQPGGRPRPRAARPRTAWPSCPAAPGPWARIASGVSESLVSRAADVCLKERRTLVLCVRETPLNRIHLENLLRVHDAGAVVMPLMPSFYHHPQTLEDLFQAFATRVLDQFGLREAGPPALGRDRPVIPRPGLGCEPPFWARGPHLQTVAANYLPGAAAGPALGADPPGPGGWRRPGPAGRCRAAPEWRSSSSTAWAAAPTGHYLRRAAARFQRPGPRGAGGEPPGRRRGRRAGPAVPTTAAPPGTWRRCCASPGPASPATCRWPWASPSAPTCCSCSWAGAARELPGPGHRREPARWTWRPAPGAWCRASTGATTGISSAGCGARCWPGPAPGRCPPTPTLRAFDAAYTAPQAGFPSRDAYYAQCSCGPHLAGIQVPTVILTALDDPFAPGGDMPGAPARPGGPPAPGAPRAGTWATSSRNLPGLPVAGLRPGALPGRPGGPGPLQTVNLGGPPRSTIRI